METTQSNDKERDGGGIGNPANDISGVMATSRKDNGGKVKATGQAKWSFLVYMAGDNNLDGAALRDIAEMARAGSTKDVNILVQLDRIEDNLTRRFRITQGGGFKTDCIQTFGDTNTGDPQILYEFVKWAADNYPADRYALILWNHGSGWWEDAKSRAAGPAAKKPRRRLFRHPVRYPVPQEHVNIPVPQEHRSICYDDTSGGDALDNSELRIVLAGICALLGRKIDLLGMDACLMNMVEVAYQLRESVNVIVGSEIEEPFDGWPYAEILTRLTARPRQDAAALARWIVKSYLLSYKGKDETVTQSALDVSRIGEMTAKVDALSASLLAALETDSKLIEAAWRRSPRFYDDNYIDLACFTKNLRKKADAELQAKVVDLIAALKAGKGRAILCQGKIGRQVRGTCGLSIYFPGDRINTAYRNLDFSGDCKWIAFLERFLS
ncbi:MAG: clostripain-related cysteine peptidase [Deltaproteobacteria bacterium]|nr:clostripain-related cysteine peptidase [Deltaproteobacteria bacterium]